ncbi:MAG: ABC transporter substrate-binding protein [Actinobacteria bacterium]|nr:ABC transporter substrate-binding protein [Actinomycetota bacterium]
MTVKKKIGMLIPLLDNSIQLLALCILIWTGFIGAKEGTEIKEAYKIGAIFDISGQGSSLGIPERDTTQMIIDDLNRKGGVNGHQVELIMLDSKSDEAEAALAAEKLIEQGVLAVVGGSRSGTAMAMLDAFQKAEITLVSTVAGTKMVDPVNERKWVFQTAHSDSLAAEKIVAFLKSKGLTKVAFAGMNNAYGDSGQKEFSAAAAKAGITIIASERFGPNDKDLTSQLANIKKHNPQAVVCWAIPPSASSFTVNYRRLGLTMPLIHSHGIGNKNFLDLAGDAADGVLFPAGKLLAAENLSASDPQKTVLALYATKFKASYGAPSNTFGGHASDAVNIVIGALREAGPDKAKIRYEIENSYFVGISGVFNMSPTDHNGLDPDSLVFVKVENGEWVQAN